MFKFLELKPEPFALDFSDLSLKIIKLKKRGESLSVSSFGEASIPEGVIRNGEIKKEELLTEAIKKAVSAIKGSSLSTEYVVASLPERKAYIQVIQMPPLAPDDLKAAVVFEAENYIPLPVEEVYLDSEIISPSKGQAGKIDVLLAALPKKTVDPYFSALKKSGLKPVALEIESFSIARALIKKETAKEAVLILDLGPKRTTFIVFSGNSLKCSFSIPVSGQNFTEAISRHLRVDFREAEKMKGEQGLERKSKEGKEVFDALVPSLSDLTEQIKKYLAYYHSHVTHEYFPLDGKEVKKAIISGQEANLKGLKSFLSEQLSLEVALGDPWVNILSEKAKREVEPSAAKSLSFASALGLALRAVKEYD